MNNIIDTFRNTVSDTGNDTGNDTGSENIIENVSEHVIEKMVPGLRKILYVDDDPDLREIARISLERSGEYTVLTAANGRQALAFIPGFRPDLIIIDVIMPDMDGPATVEEIRKIPGGVDIPVAFLTSRLEQQDCDEYRRIGALGVLAKPIRPSQLALQIRQLWEQRRIK